MRWMPSDTHTSHRRMRWVSSDTHTTSHHRMRWVPSDTHTSHHIMRWVPSDTHTTSHHRMRWVSSDTLHITAQKITSASRYISAWTQTLYSTHAVTPRPKLWITTHKQPSSFCVRHLDRLNQPYSHVFFRCHGPEPFTQTNRHPGHDAAMWLASNTPHHAGVTLSAVFPVRCKPVWSSVAPAIQWIHRR